MTAILGLVIVLVCVAGGFAMAGGPFPVLFQPNEFVVIAGAAAGSLVASAPGGALGRVKRAFGRAFSKPPTKSDYEELFKLMENLFQVIRREGMLALESHVWEPEKSPIFSKHPGVMARHHASHFLVEGLKLLVDGTHVEDLTLLFDMEMETMHEEEAEPVGLIRTTSDALPGLGIVAAVLGIIITMGHLDGGPEEIGHHVAAALVGTFLGILLCYGIVSPLATAIELANKAESRYINCIRVGLLAAARGVNPAVAVEYSRRAVFTEERPETPKDRK